MKLIDEWRVVARKAWSMKLIYLASAISAVHAAEPYLPLKYTGPSLAVLTLIITFTAGVSRVVEQPKMSETKA